MNIPVLRIKDENGQYQDIPAIKGAKGDKGDPGTNGVNGGYYEPSVSSSGDLSWTPSKSGMPDVATSNIKGPQGEQGPTGQTGPKGDTPNVTVGTTTTSDPGGDASVTKNSSSTEDNAIFDFVIPRGEQGPQGNPGSDGKSPTVNVGTTTTGPAGSQASVTNSGTETDAVFNFTIPVGIQGQRGEKGDTGSVFTPSVDADGIISWTNNGGLENPPSQDIKGPKGDKGDSATITIGTTTTGNEGTNATVTNTGTSSDAVFNFTIPRGNTGAQGEAATINVGTTETISPGTSAEVSNSGTSSNAVFNFKIPRGEKGDTGDTGATPSINVGTTTTGNPGTEASVTKDKSSTETNVIFDFTIPRGDKGETGEQGIKGDKGDTGVTFTPSVSQDGIISWTNDGDLNNPSSVDIKGDKGDAGEAATIEIGTTTTGLPGSQASVTNSGTSEKAVFNFSIPKGEKGNTGDTGPRGEAATVSVGTTTTGDPGGSASVTNSGTSSDAVFNFVIPRGQQGTPGQDGITPTISAGTTTTGDSGTNASVTKDPSSTESEAIFNFTIPRGDKGDTGETGPQGSAATVSIGKTTTGNPGTSASVTNSGTSSEAVFNFTIPKGDTGSPGAKGDTGAVFTPSVSSEGIISWTNNGGLQNPSSVNIKGPKGDNGSPGSPGSSATITVGSTTTSDPGTSASVTNSGTSSAAIFNFTIPKGEKGDPGDNGLNGENGGYYQPSVSSGGDLSWTPTDPNMPSVSSVNIKGPQGNQGLQGPQGIQGVPGADGVDGISPTVSVGTTTTGQAGSQAIVQNSGTETDVVLDFTIPRGIQGDKGDNGSTFTPSVSESGIISWTNDGGLPNPSPQNIRGPQGQNGSPGLYVGNSAPSDANIRLWVKPVDDYVFSYSNPNLLINSNFMDPINQRGETTYSGNAYGIDRWKGATVGSSIGISGSGVLIMGQITQYVEMKSSNIGRTMTMSSCDSNGNIKSITGELDTSSVSGNDMSFVYNGSKYSIAASIGGGTRYRWVKLEFGSSPTLYVPRSRAEEVMLCLRYYWRIQQTNSDFNYFGVGIANASTNTYFTINLPVYMRDFPELGYGGNFQCYGGNGNFPIGSLAESPFTSTTDPIDDQTSTYTLMAVRNGGSQTAGHVYNLNGTTPGSYIEFDSEIY